MTVSENDAKANQWYVRLGGKVGGPFSTSRVIQLIREGKLDHTTEVRSATNRTWRPACEISSLFPGSSTARRLSDAEGTNQSKWEPLSWAERQSDRRVDGVRRDVTIQAVPAIGLPVAIGLLFACLDLEFTTIGQRILTFFATTAILLLITIPVFVYQCYPEYQKRLVGVAKGMVGLALSIGGIVFGGFLLRAVLRDPERFFPNTQQYVAVEFPDRKEGEWISYVDTKGRFQCEIPPGWDARHTIKGEQSQLVLTHDEDEIRITVRNTQHHVLNEADRAEIVDGMNKLAGKIGDGKVVEEEWTALSGSRALRIDLNSTNPSVFVRSIKAKHKTYDHFIAMYIKSTAPERQRLLELFGEFLQRFDPPE